MGLFGSWSSTFNTLGHINNGLGTLNNYLNMKNNGASTGQALTNSAINGTVGAARVEYASERYDRTGSMSGHFVNTMAGYGDTASNVRGTLGLMLTEPSMYGCGAMPIWGGGFGFGGGCCTNNFFIGGPTMVTPTFAGPVVTNIGMMGPMSGGCCTPFPGGRLMGGGFWC